MLVGQGENLYRAMRYIENVEVCNFVASQNNRRIHGILILGRVTANHRGFSFKLPSRVNSYIKYARDSNCD